MKYEIRYKPSFSAIFITLEPGESITTESGTMVSMEPKLKMKTKFSGGFFSALLKKIFGDESFFVNKFVNSSQQPQQVVLTQSLIGDIDAIALKRGEAICLQSGAYIAHTKGIKLGVRWAGFSSWFAGEGLFKVKAKAEDNGIVFFGGYGGIIKHHISGEFIVDSGHLIAYEPGIRMSISLVGGLIGSVTSGEGFVNKLSGNGVIYLQSRSLDGLVKFLTPKVL